ncbi:uncharacterized protein PV07_08692 [Cladophialophora immunda]|uniref:Uncharacterized protein n=1 Tax=Cladophialophora immunda TaxID=569365 RepID=A0A0D1ZCT6_9EURO|nr:uncharacterized protein PV07_08692 [Cladophialophora immunda]KIW25526.1 hypothetical protein PV07_08692 [Cladophialophora immunda]
MSFTPVALKAMEADFKADAALRRTNTQTTDGSDELEDVPAKAAEAGVDDADHPTDASKASNVKDADAVREAERKESRKKAEKKLRLFCFLVAAVLQLSLLAGGAYNPTLP